jgi:hypothetical protein
MKPKTKTILKWSAGVFLLLLVLGLAMPCTNCPQTAARRFEARLLIRSFDIASRRCKAQFGSYPTGNPSEILAALAGRNSQRMIFLDLRERSLNQAGELIDFWRTPFRFEHVSDSEPPKLTSAGPDKAFGTQDDVTLNNE